MRRLSPIFLVALLLGCKSTEERACANSIELIAEAGAARDDGRTEREREAACVEGLRRLQQDIQPDDATWQTYLQCLIAADSMDAQFDCLQPLTELQRQQLADQLPTKR